MNKLIVFDCGYLTHLSIFSWASEKKRLLERGIQDDPVLASYGYLNTVYSVLKKIGITKTDKILFAKDGWDSFRKAFYLPYKAQRKEFRESHEEIDWSLQYSLINKLEKQLDETTNWNFIQLNETFNFADLCLTDEGQKLGIKNYNIDYSTEYGCEADDLMAIAPKVYLDHEVILVATDKDLQQLYFYKNCKIFNPSLKSPTNKSKKGYYIIVNNALNIITKKVRSGDISDNILVDKKSDTERDVEIRKFIIDMLNMPNFVEKPITTILNNLDWNKNIDYNNLAFPNSLGNKFDTIYESKDIRSWEQSIKAHELREEKRKEKARANYAKKKEKEKSKVKVWVL